MIGEAPSFFCEDGHVAQSSEGICQALDGELGFGVRKAITGDRSSSIVWSRVADHITDLRGHALNREEDAPNEEETGLFVDIANCSFL